ncbi:MAG: NAD(P)H-hydrate dehydratase [Gallionella sp.]|nr:NAD(P)H-hydrate dehydratase [Gallionella sp.]
MIPIPLTADIIINTFPARPHDSHKGLFGTVAIIGGDTGMVGAPLLAGRAALKLGAGCVRVGILAECAPAVDVAQPELMLSPASAIFTTKFTILAMGCGMGGSEAARALLAQGLQCAVPLVLDADALNLLANNTDLQTALLARDAATVLTPHPAEAARLLGCSTQTVQTDRVAAVQRLAQQYHCSVVLKGADSLCATQDGRLFINTTGNSGMSTAGMGDVLTGIIAALIAQGMRADDALLLGVHLHGAAGDALAQQNIAIGMTATELIDAARRVLNQWLTEKTLVSHE